MIIKGREHLDDVHPDLRAVMLLASDRSSVDFAITDGIRTLAEQKANVAKGVSKTMRSRHLTGHAVDILAYKNGKDAWKFPSKEQAAVFVPAANEIKRAAKDLGVPLEWGWEIWGWDAPHFQLPWDKYPEGSDVSFLDPGKNFDPSRFNEIVALVLDTEGGWNPADPSMRGVTMDTLLRHNPQASLTDLKNLSAEDAKLIYRSLYWAPIDGDNLPPGLDYAMMDFGVHSGPWTAVKHLQRIVGTTDDGQMGPLTRAAIGKADVEDVIMSVMDARFARMKTLDNWEVNKNGWTARINKVRADALAMAAVSPPTTKPEPPPVIALSGYSNEDLVAELLRRLSLSERTDP